MEQGTYLQRVQRIAKMMDIRTAFVTDKKLQEALDLLKAHEAGKALPPKQLEWARHIKEAIVHPDTGEKIFMPLRLSFIVPCNLVLDMLMLSARSPLQNVGAQWLNQTYNSLHYYANRNASNQESTAQILTAYAGATASSVGAVLALNRALDHMPPTTRWLPVARRVVPFFGVAAADYLNLGITRKNEFLEGIKVTDENGEEVGRSCRAGLYAVNSCILGRIGAAAPVLVLPALAMHRLETLDVIQRRPLLGHAALMGMIGTAITVVVPLVFGIFKQNAHVPATWLEPEFHHLKGPDGKPKELYYNKGL